MLYVGRIVAIAAVYYGAAKLGLSLAFTTPNVTAVWAPTGISLAAIVLWGPRVWPGVALGAFLANAWTDVPLYTTVGITIGNTLEALVGAYLLRRFADFRPSLERVRDVIALVLLGGILSTMVSASIGVASLLAGDVIDAADIGSTWRTWWLGDMGGDLIVAPALMVAATQWPFRQAPGRLPEAIVVALLVGGVAALVFTREVAMAFLLIPVLAIVTLRFWQPGAVGAALLISAIAIPLTEADMGPFSGNSPDERLLLAQAFLGTATLTMMVLAAVLAERKRTESRVEEIADTLQRSLLPRQMPEIPGIEIALDFRPAGERHLVGGDFYDVFATDDHGWAVVVGDVLGKGASAAATTALARYTLRAVALHEAQPSEILGELNRAIMRQSPDQSCTIAYSQLEPDGAGGARVTLATGGHPPPLVVRANGELKRLGTPASMLGVEPDARYFDDAAELEPGDALVLYTDGLTDAYAPQRFVNPDELRAALRSCAGQSAAGIVSAVGRAILDQSSAEPRDDILLLVARVSP
jgi:integral membrane sensor domain MASE1